MAVPEIIAAPDARLRQISKPVARVDDAVKKLIATMFAAMYQAGGIGLAAIQIGVAQRIVIMDLSEDQSAPRVFINPEILEQSKEREPFAEGCLSVPGIVEEVLRPANIRARWLDENGAAHEENCSELLAVCLQHEMDHLNGILFIDHISRLKRERALAALKKAKKRQPEIAAQLI